MSDTPRSILVIIVARIGDTLLATPILRALKAAWPDAKLTVAAHPNRREVLEGLPFIDRLLPIDKRRAPWLGRWPGGLGGNRWDLALVYGEDQPLLSYALRVSHQVIAFEQADATINERLRPAIAKPREPLHAVDERALLLRPLDIRLTARRLAYQVRDDERDAARRWLAARLPGDGPIYGLQPSSFPTKAYRDWPEARFIAVGERLLARAAGARVLVLGGQEGREVAERVATALGPRAASAAGQLRLRESAALMSVLDLYLGVDTGPTHIAGALDMPMVALYHCHHPGRFLQPLEHPRGVFLEHPATGGDCPREAPMSAIDVDSVMAAIDQVLA